MSSTIAIATTARPIGVVSSSVHTPWLRERRAVPIAPKRQERYDDGREARLRRERPQLGLDLCAIIERARERP